MNKSNIPTCDMTWNPVRGCANRWCFLHPKNKGGCWAARMCGRWAEQWAAHEARYQEGRYWLVDNGRFNANYTLCKMGLDRFEPTWFQGQYEKLNNPGPKESKRIFVCSQTDIAYINDREWVNRIINMIYANNRLRANNGLPVHQFQFLTKAPSVYLDHDWPHNCWLGFTATNQKEFDSRASAFWGMKYRVHYAYLEPMLEKINIMKGFFLKWVVVGGQNGNGAAPLDPEWVRSVRDQCLEHGIPFYFKGWGEYLPAGQDSSYIRKENEPAYQFPCGEFDYYRTGSRSGNTIDGENWEQFPEVTNE